MHQFSVHKATFRFPGSPQKQVESKYSQAVFRFPAINNGGTNANGMITPYAILLPNVEFTVFASYLARQLIDQGNAVNKIDFERKVYGLQIKDPDAYAARTTLQLCCRRGLWTKSIDIETYFSDVAVKQLKAMLKEAKEPAKGFVFLRAFRSDYDVSVGSKYIELAPRKE